MKRALSTFCIYFSAFAYIAAIVCCFNSMYDQMSILFAAGIVALLVGLLCDIGEIAGE